MLYYSLMENSNGIFENLVNEISSGERQALLDKLTDSSSGVVEVSQAKDNLSLQDDKPVEIEEQYEKEPLFSKIWCFIVGLFTSRKAVDVYVDRRILNLGISISKNLPGFIDVKKRNLTGSSYEKFDRLSSIASFFQDNIAGAVAEPASFYLVLGSVVMPMAHSTLTGDLNTPVQSSQNEILGTSRKNDARAGFFRRMEDDFSGINEQERSEMYGSVQAFDWLRRLGMVPFDKLLLKYSDFDNVKTCPLNIASDILASAANVLCSPAVISLKLLEAVFLFNNRQRIENGVCETDKEMEVFLTKARDLLGSLQLILSEISFLDLCRFAKEDLCFFPQRPEGVENWFVLYKNGWKKRFENAWNQWAKKQRYLEIQKHIYEFLKTESLPEIAYRPWLEINSSLFFRKEMSFSFLKGFFQNVFPLKVFKPLRSILSEGEFIKRENQQEYTDSYNTLIHMKDTISGFEHRLSVEGDIGISFIQVKKEKLVSISGKSKTESLMMTIDSEGSMIVTKCCQAFRSIMGICTAITERSRTGEYQGLANYGLIEGVGNEGFQKKLAEALNTISEALDIVKDLESMELDL